MLIIFMSPKLQKIWLSVFEFIFVHQFSLKFIGRSLFYFQRPQKQLYCVVPSLIQVKQNIKKKREPLENDSNTCHLLNKANVNDSANNIFEVLHFHY